MRSLITSGATDYLCGKCKCGLADNIDIDELNAILGSDSDKEAEQQEEEPQQQQQQVKDFIFTSAEVSTVCSCCDEGWCRPVCSISNAATGGWSAGVRYSCELC